ncbi:glycerol-3-phosphate dehydrogenase [Leucothrix sargassi]|nr:glycerol-3-phosphate dehydrogenase [Leucothrix sargassi]
MIKSSEAIYDVVVVGGGINGCGIARDAAGRGLSVALFEKDDLAQATSSSSTKLIHGGLRYLEHYEFRLVREALTEREILLQSAPHIIWPMRFVLPHHKELRPAWLLRCGLFLYDYIGGRKILPATKTLDLRKTEYGKPLIDMFQKGFEYSDCWVDDARLVALNALDARERGAEIYTRTRCTHAERIDGIWHITVKCEEDQSFQKVKARTFVNAAGPWVDDVLGAINERKPNQRNVRLVRGSHVIVPKLYDHDRAYIFQNADNRIIFAVPYEQDFTLLGTTDQDHKSMDVPVEISEDETQYICDAASVYFKKPITRDSVVWTYSGVRPLFNDGASEAQEATRDYVLKVKDSEGKAPILNIFGGKITTYRHLAEDALDKLSEYLPEMDGVWTSSASLPGGEFDVSEVDTLIAKLQSDYPFLSERWATRLFKAYGKLSWDLLKKAKSKEDLGQAFGETLTEAELVYLKNVEWATTADDALWRRSKLGLHMTEAERAEVAEWFARNAPASTCMEAS